MKRTVSNLLSALLILLFLYTGLLKALERDVFLFTLKRSPWSLLQSTSVIVSWVLPYLEVLVAVALIIPRTRLWGFYASTVLMISFLLYVAIIVGSGVQLPCSCGGVIQQLTWEQHIYFNLVYVAIAIWGTLNERGLVGWEYKRKVVLT